MTLEAYLEDVGVLACNENPHLPALDQVGFTWGDMTALLDRQGLFLSKCGWGRTVYLSPQVYYLAARCRPRRPMPPEAAALYQLLAEAGPLETEELKRLSLLDGKGYTKAFTFLLKYRWATALKNGRVLGDNWSTLRYGTAEAWEALAPPPVPAADPEGQLWAILGRTLPPAEVARFLRAL